ncbi:MBL fold metallo-hydrolase [Aneurinibacillus uraniidurans]|uniref:MBL fold metallo-hydrolase n=1 Tax=Aneurinibacillus uraniidurans TaxID=2966586 RepID=UPI002349029F|nr:MBL fold metallo-hydrolase [Aneurinibacillus sp. B1]WCN39205.1 MBL fold metallo-hydrolase [Aneurinibacillus sp. B1]
MRIANGVEMLELQAEGFGGRMFLNPTLIWDDETAILIDTGMPGDMEKLRAAMIESGVSFDKVKAIILSHQDIDHIGSTADIVHESNGRIEVYAHELDKPYIEGTLPLIKTNPSSIAKVAASLPENERQKLLALCENPPTAKVDKTLVDGQELPYCGGILVLFTPGHTPGHISLYLKQSKTLIVGDAMVSVDGILHGPVQRTTLDMDTALRSLEKFLPLDIETVICYHGGVCTGNIKDQLRAIIKDH